MTEHPGGLAHDWQTPRLELRHEPILWILWLAVAAVPVVLPFAAGRRHRSVKVAVAVAIIGITNGCAVLGILFYLNMGWNMGH